MKEEKQLTYEDFEIGQKVTCKKLYETENENDDYKKNSNIEFWEQHLTVGKQYKIKDLDFHFWDKLCVKSDNKKISMFVPIDLFCNEEDLLRITREKKLKRITKYE